MTDQEFMRYLYDKRIKTHQFVRFYQLLATTNYATSRMRRPVCDIGCGDGEFARLLNLNFKVDLGVDVSERSLRRARRRRLYKSLLKSEIGDLGLLDKTFNTVICNSVLEHLDDLNGAVDGIRRIMSRNGVLMGTVPIKGWDRNLIFTKFHGPRYGRLINKLYGHKNVMSIQRWRGLFLKHGMRIVTIKKYVSQYANIFADVLFTERWVSGLESILYQLYLNDERLCKAGNAGAIYFEVAKR